MNEDYDYGPGQNDRPAHLPLIAQLPERDADPRTVFGLLWQMVSRPGRIRDVGISGVNGFGMLAQLLLALAACLLTSAILLSRIDPEHILHGHAAMYIVGRPVWLATFGVMLLFFAMLASSGATILGLLSGLAVMEILVSLSIFPVLVVPWLLQHWLGDLGLMPYMLWVYVGCRVSGYGMIVAGVLDISWGGGLGLAIALRILALLPMVIAMGLVFGTGG
jgi:hypothetical protein